MSESLRVANHFSDTNLHILPVKLFSQKILLYFPKSMGLVKDLVTCVVVNGDFTCLHGMGRG